MTQAMAETMAMAKMPAVNINKAYYEKYLAHADNLVSNKQDFFKAWLRKDCFICTDLGCKPKIKTDTLCVIIIFYYSVYTNWTRIVVS